MALSSHLLPGKELIIVARILFFIAFYGIDIVSDRQQHIQHIVLTKWLHIHYIALWTAAIHLQSLITRRPQVQVLSLQPCLTADFVRNQRFFVFFRGFRETRIGTLAPTVPQRGVKSEEWILWRLQNVCRYFVFKWFMRYNICRWYIWLICDKCASEVQRYER